MLKEREDTIWKRRKILLREMFAILLLTLALIYCPFLPRIKGFILNFLLVILQRPLSNLIFVLSFLFALFIWNLKFVKSLIKYYLYGSVLWLLVISCFLLFSPTRPWINREQFSQFILCFLSFALLWIRHRYTQFGREDLISEDIGLDDPLIDPADDRLNHAPFTENVFKVIKTLPESNIRIAITGEWGCGKSTCLNFMEVYSKRDKFPVVRFNPWKFSSKEELWKGFVAGIDKGISDWKGLPYGPFSKNSIVFNLLSLVRNKIIFLNIGRLFDDLFLSRLQPSFEITKENVSLTLLDILKGKKLIVLIDDLDRAPEAIVYQTLLLIKEIVDVRGCIFVCGLDLEATTNKLKHCKIENGILFSEKIFQLFLPVPSSALDYKKNLINTTLKRLNPPIKEEIIMKNFSLLPDNPRKLKAYFRLLSALQGVLLQRFGDEDLSWEFLYLAELLKLRYPERVELILQDQSFYEYIEMSPFYRDKREDSKRVKELHGWRDKINDKFTKEKTENNDFEEIVKIISTAGFGLGGERIKSYFRILTHVDHLTWKEYRKWKRDQREDLLNKLVNNDIHFLQRREFILALMRDREQILAQESDEWDHDKREKMMQEAVSITSDCLWYIQQDVFKNANPPLLDVSLCGEWLSLLRKWAHFESKFYAKIRQLEKELAITLAKQTINLAPEVLEKQDLWREHDFLEHEKAFEETMKAIKDVYSLALSKKLIEDFEKLDSIKALWGQEHRWSEKNLLFKPNNYFYTVENKKKLHELAKKAETNRIIQGNFYQFLRMLFYAALDPMSSFQKEPTLELIKDDELRELFWAGATCARIQRRHIGSLLNNRKEISKILSRTGILPIPEWVKQEESDLLEIFKI